MLAVQVLVQTVVVTFTIFEDQRCRPLLAVPVTAFEHFPMRIRKSRLAAESFMPFVGDRRQERIKLLAQRRDDPGQRIPEILVLSLAKTVPAHDDVAAKRFFLRVQGRERSSVRAAEQRAKPGVAAFV
jgi:hypothetical protein